VITRHFIHVNGRRVHYRKAGSGPPLLMVHQSPRSSAEYEPLMSEWAERFTCIAPDTPGFGESDPLPEGAEIDAFADSLVEFLDAVGVERTGAYGFHSGGIILVTAVKRHPQRFTALAVGGYAVWTDEEREIFDREYLPPFRPSAYGEHLIWLWNRILEQSWFFPWFDVRNETRLPGAHADPARVDAVVRDMLDGGDAYRIGYGAVLRAPRDIPPPDAVTPPVLITAYDGDPLQAHLSRLGELPNNWTARAVGTPKEQQDQSISFLCQHSAPETGPLREAEDRRFVRVTTDEYDGLIHWKGSGRAATVPAPGRAASLLSGFGIDPPGHGLSDPWPGEPPARWAPWDAVLQAAAEACGAERLEHEQAPNGDPDRLFPSLSPDRFGAYLVRAWGIVRARHLFDPWYESDLAHAVSFEPAELNPERLAHEHLALLKAGASKHYLLARREAEGEFHGNS
jgi:pimeloyl-ACP methyl ester carboxylesterase